MHRIPLKLNEASYTWNRSLPDYVLFSNALNNENVKDTMDLMRKIDIEQSTFDCFRENSAINNYNEALNLLQLKDERAALLVLDKLILHAPKEGRALMLALKIRGSVYYTQNRFEGSANDFELLLLLSKTITDDLLEVYCKLSISYYMLGKYDKARECNRLLQKNFPKQKRKPKGVHMTPQEAEAEKLYFTVQQLVSQTQGHNTTPGPSRKQPHHAVCWSFLMSKSSAYEDSGLYSQNNYSANTVVQCEKPIMRTLVMPWVQCEQCLEISHHMYSCFECRLKTYCSMACMKSDVLHIEECKGIKHLVVLMFNCQNLFRTFVEVIYLIQRHILAHKNLNQLKRAGDILTAIRTYAKDVDVPLLKLLAKDADYRDMSDMQFSTVLATSVRLCVFIAEKTDLVKWLRPSVDTSHIQEMIIVGSLLMQLQHHLQKEAFLLNFDVSYKLLHNSGERQTLKQRLKNCGNKIVPKKGGQNATSFFYLNKEILSLKVSTYLSIEITPPSPKPTTSRSVFISTHASGDNFIEPALEYSDFIARSVLKDEFTDDTHSDGGALSVELARMDFMTRESFMDDYVKEFNRNIFNFFFQKKLSHNEKPTKQTIVLLGRDIQKLRHSCDPNVEIILTTTGTILVKTIKPLAKGEECFVAYRCRYYQYDCRTRDDILAMFDVKCKCKYCAMPQSIEPYALYSNIYCVPACKTEFGFAEEVCPKCGRGYDILLKEYTRRMIMLETACCTDDDEREVHKQWIVMDRVSEQLFPPYNEHRIILRLKYTKFIALNNFVTQAFDMANELYYDLKKYYPEERVLFTYYPIILEALTLLQTYNIDQSLNNAPLSKLKEINDLAFTLIHVQLEHIRTHEQFDQACGSILCNYRMFVEWREKMYVKDIDVKPMESFLQNDAEMPELQKCSP